jgi:hypothetical protein
MSVCRCVNRNARETDLTCVTPRSAMIVLAAGAMGERSRIDPLIFRRASRNPFVTQLGESETPAQDNGRRNSEIGS